MILFTHTYEYFNINCYAEDLNFLSNFSQWLPHRTLSPADGGVR